MKAILDAILNKWISRKLMVFLIATGLAFWGNLTSSDWVIIATTYIGTQGAVDIVERIRKTGQQF